MEYNLKLEKMFREVITNSPNGILVTDKDDRIKYMNDSIGSFWNISVEEAIGKSLTEIRPELTALQSEDSGVRDVEINGHYYYILLFQIVETDGAVDNVFLVLNIYESKLLKSELVHQKRLATELEEILEGSYDGILVTDPDGKILYVNSSYERVAEIKKEDMKGKSMRDLMNPVWMPNAVSYVVMEQKQTVSKRQITKSGRNIIVTGKPIFDKKGEVKKIVINARDITEIYQLREELIKSQKMGKMYMDSYNDLSEEYGDKESQNLLAVSKQMQEVLALAEKVANFQATVLVLGESGVGKEEVAKYIHRNSIRKDKPFMTINCGAIPANLLESELFGYEKGAFTGAGQYGKEGLLEAADGGVAFLDEIGETPLDFQVKLLRFMETKEIRRVGAVNGRTIDVRIVAATNRDLEAMVEEGTFREDLFYRLNVVKINVPPLRKRKDDIAPLAIFFLSQFNKKYGQNKILTYDVTKEFGKYPWPGNVRQLKNVIENMVVVSNNEYLQTDDLPWEREMAVSPNRKIVQNVFESEEISLIEATELLEKMMLERAIETCKTTREIADKLRVNQSTIVRKMQKYGLKI